MKSSYWFNLVELRSTCVHVWLLLLCFNSGSLSCIYSVATSIYSNLLCYVSFRFSALSLCSPVKPEYTSDWKLLTHSFSQHCFSWLRFVGFFHSIWAGSGSRLWLQHLNCLSSFVSPLVNWGVHAQFKMTVRLTKVDSWSQVGALALSFYHYCDEL